MSDKVTDPPGPDSTDSDPGTASGTGEFTVSSSSAIESDAESPGIDAAGSDDLARADSPGRKVALETGSTTADPGRTEPTAPARSGSRKSSGTDTDNHGRDAETGGIAAESALTAGAVAESSAAGSAGKNSGTAISDAAADRDGSQAESGSAEASPAPRSRPFPRPRLGRAGRIAVSGLAVILFLAAVASSVYFYLQNQHNKATLTAQQQARDTACTYGPVLATYDSKHLDTYFSAVLAGATGAWRKQFDSTSKDLRDVLVKGEVTTSVRDVQCAIVSADSTSAQAVVVIGQTITSLGTRGKPEPGQLSISMRLEKDGNRWLVNKVDSPLAATPGS